MRLARYIGCLIFWNLGLTAAVMAQKAPSSSVYTCTDASGQHLTSDRPIPQCQDREQRVLGPSGMERSRLGPALTETEMAERLEQRRQAALLQQREKEQRRRDAALLARYPDRRSHDAARRDSLQTVEEQEAMVQKRLSVLDREQLQLQQEMEFYAKAPGKAPVRLRSNLRAVDQELQEQRLLLQGHQEEALRVHSRFDAELQRLQPLWNAQAGAAQRP